MNNFDSALAELAEQLGVRTDEFLTWMTTGGMQSYAELQASRHLTTAGIFVLVFIGCLIGFLVCYSINRGKSWMDRDDGVFTAQLLTGCIGCVLIFFVLFELRDGFLWHTNPEGMIVEMLIAKLG